MTQVLGSLYLRGRTRWSDRLSPSCYNHVGRKLPLSPTVSHHSAFQINEIKSFQEKKKDEFGNSMETKLKKGKEMQKIHHIIS